MTMIPTYRGPLARMHHSERLHGWVMFLGLCQSTNGTFTGPLSFAHKSYRLHNLLVALGIKGSEWHLPSREELREWTWQEVWRHRHFAADGSLNEQRPDQAWPLCRYVGPDLAVYMIEHNDNRELPPLATCLICLAAVKFVFFRTPEERR